MHVPLKKRVLALLAGLLALSVAAPAFAEHENGSHPFGDPRFEERRDRTERPVIEGHVDRTWIWGPGPYTEALMEPYADSPGGERMVQYFDKSRMEINDPDAEGLWSVTNGLLVVEMIEGRFQTGDNDFDYSPDPAEVQIAGDAAGTESPTYADIASFELRDVEPLAEGTVVSEYLAMTSIEQSDAYAAYGIEAAYHVSETNHTVAAPFWEFMNSTGLIWDGGSLVAESLFQNPFYATGYPVTEAYWTTTPVDGESQDVLWQCFERRCMTYTPDNPEGWEVETGNVGQHYFEWRYGGQHDDDDDAVTENVYIYLVDIDGSDDGIPMGTGESLIPVEVEVEARDTLEGRITAAVNAMTGYQHEWLTNAYADADAPVESVTINNQLATVNFTGDIPIGGVGDHPRIEQQLEYTVTQFEGIDEAVGLLNGGPIIQPLGTPGDGVVATFDVGGEQFNVWTINNQTIADLEAMWAGNLQDHFPYGPVVLGSGEADFNGPWDWHMDPTDVSMTNSAPEACDVTPSGLESSRFFHVDEVGTYCPSGAELIELQDFR
jgi:hypothetical protein